MKATINDRPLVAIFWLMLATALWSWSLSWRAPILDRHEFRQTQTAISAHWIKQAGYQLDYETPLFGPPWSIPMEFPVYQWCVAQLSRTTGLPLEQSGRATSILFLLATLPAVYLLAGLAGLARSGRLLVVAAVLSSPTYLFYGRAFMIESTALCFSVWFILSIGLAVRDLSLRWSFLATVCGTLAALTKITTFALYCFPAAGLALWFGLPHWKLRHQRTTGFWRAIFVCSLPILISAGIGEWWVSHSDAVKASNPFSLFLQSSEMAAWNWGTLDQRFSSIFWQQFWSNLSSSVLSTPALLIMIICSAVAGWRWRCWAAAGTASFLLGPLLFANLYFRHDYYYSANTLLLLFGAGLLLAAMWSTSFFPRYVKGLLLILFFGSQLAIFYRGHGGYHRSEIPRPPELATIIREIIPAEEVVLIYGWDWNSLLPYYAERRALMAPGGREYEFETLDQIAAKLPPRQITAMVVKRTAFNAPPSFSRERATRFGLHPIPFATSPDGDLYLTKETLVRATAQLAGRTFQTVTLLDTATPPPMEDELKESDLTALDLSSYKPRPIRSRSLFGASISDLNGRSVLNAHAPSEFEIIPPSAATHLVAEFGLAEGAYAGEQPLTDGIGVTISEVRADAPPRILFRRSLDPVRNPADRGVQKIELTAIGPLTGQLLFVMDPGPKGSLVKDWAYWASIEIN